MQAVIVSFQSFAATSLGCYGNDWVETPHWDRFAAHGTVFDQHFAQFVDAQHVLAQLGEPLNHRADSRVAADWSVAPATWPVSPVGRTSLGERLRAHGIASHLWNADSLWRWQTDFGFDDVHSISGDGDTIASADRVSFALLVNAAREFLDQTKDQSVPRVLWLHSSGPAQPPPGFDTLYLEDFEERGIEFVAMTDEQRARHPAVYGGSVSLLDHWLGQLLEPLQTTARPTLVIVVAAEGRKWQPQTGTLNDHPAASLFDQCTRTPLTLQILDDRRNEQYRSLRCDRLVQAGDLPATLLDWFGHWQPSEDDNHRSLLREALDEGVRRRRLHLESSSGDRAIRTANWLCIGPHSTQTDVEQAASSALLFVKPDDLWDVNNVAAQHGELVKELLLQSPANYNDLPAQQ